jgi:alpha-1,2-mannosyltransferase
MINLLRKIRPLLNPIRLRYPYFIGGALWISWLVSQLMGPGYVDAAGHLIGTDFVAFYTAGKILLLDRASDLYDLELAKDIQQPLYNAPTDNFNPYLNPPFYAWLFIPFARLPYPWSPILWMVVNLFFLWVGLKFLNVQRVLPVFLLILTWQPSFAAISFGQNAFLSFFLISLVFALWKKKMPFASGLAAGLLLYKPQLLIGIGLLWLLGWRKNWRALAGLSVTGILLAGLSLLFMPEASYQYIFYTQKIAANLMIVEGFPIWNAHAVQAFWLALFPGQKMLAQLLYAICAITGLLYWLKFWRKEPENTVLQFGAAVCLTVWVTPYMMIYDWVLLLVPAVLFWHARDSAHDELLVVYAILWIVQFFSSVLTFLQWNALGWAIQISIPSLAGLLVVTYKILTSPPINTQELTGA